MRLKTFTLSAIGIIVTFFTKLVGGFDYAFLSLIIIMVLDYLSGMAVPIFTKQSPKTDNGGLNSAVGFIGLVKKVFIIGFVIIGTLCDNLLGVDMVRQCIIYAFMVNELLSITENAGLLGLPIPKALTNCIELLKNKTEGAGQDE